ncbi:MAG: hypothetical protein WC763_00450 [Candidatus Paceibacterota bacterium]
MSSYRNLRDREIEIIPGNPGEPVFASCTERDRFWERFYEKVQPELDELARKRALCNPPFPLIRHT